MQAIEIQPNMVGLDPTFCHHFRLSSLTPEPEQQITPGISYLPAIPIHGSTYGTLYRDLVRSIICVLRTSESCDRLGAIYMPTNRYFCKPGFFFLPLPWGLLSRRAGGVITVRNKRATI